MPPRHHWLKRCVICRSEFVTPGTQHRPIRCPQSGGDHGERYGAGVHRQRLRGQTRLAAGLLPYLDDPSVAMIGGRVVAPASARGAVALAFEAVRSPLDMGATDASSNAAVCPICRPAIYWCGVMCCWRMAASTQRCGSAKTWISSGAPCGTGIVPGYVPAGRVVHDHRVRWGDWLRRRADYSSSEADLQQRYPEGYE